MSEREQLLRQDWAECVGADDPDQLDQWAVDHILDLQDKLQACTKRTSIPLSGTVLPSGSVQFRHDDIDGDGIRPPDDDEDRWQPPLDAIDKPS